MKDLKVILLFIAAFLVMHFVFKIVGTIIFSIGVPALAAYFALRYFKVI